MDVTTWDFEGSDWANPDPGDWRYLGALSRALHERREAAGLTTRGSAVWRDWTHTPAAFDFTAFDAELAETAGAFIDDAMASVEEHLDRRVAEVGCGDRRMACGPLKEDDAYWVIGDLGYDGVVVEKIRVDGSTVETEVKWTSASCMTNGAALVRSLMYRMSWSRMLERAGADQSAPEAAPSIGMDGFTFKSQAMRAWVSLRRRMLPTLTWAAVEAAEKDSDGKPLPDAAFDFLHCVRSRSRDRYDNCRGSQMVTGSDGSWFDDSPLSSVNAAFGGVCRFWWCWMYGVYYGFVPFDVTWRTGEPFEQRGMGVIPMKGKDTYNPGRNAGKWCDCGLELWESPAPNPDIWRDGPSNYPRDRLVDFEAEAAVEYDGGSLYGPRVTVSNDKVVEWCLVDGVWPPARHMMDGSLRYEAACPDPYKKTSGGTGYFTTGFNLPFGGGAMCEGAKNRSLKCEYDQYEDGVAVVQVRLNSSMPWQYERIFCVSCVGDFFLGSTQGSIGSVGWVAEGPGEVSWTEKDKMGRKTIKLWNAGEAGSVSTWWQTLEIRSLASGRGAARVEIFEDRTDVRTGSEGSTGFEDIENSVTAYSTMDAVASDAYVPPTAPGVPPYAVHSTLQEAGSLTIAGSKDPVAASAWATGRKGGSKGRCYFAFSKVALPAMVRVATSFTFK
jgi:hypothetical protein